MFNENGEIVPIIDPVSSDSSDSNDGSPGDNHDGDYGVHDYEFSDDEGDNGGNADNGDNGFSDSSTSDESLTRDTASPFATSAVIASAGEETEEDRAHHHRHHSATPKKRSSRAQPLSSQTKLEDDDSEDGEDEDKDDVGSGRLKGSKGKSSRGRFDPSSSDIHTAAFTHARALAMSKPPARDGSEAEEDPSLRAMRQMRAARELRKWVRLYKREYGDDLDKMPGMSDIKAKLKGKGKGKKTTDGADGENRPTKSPVISQPLGSGSSEEGGKGNILSKSRSTAVLGTLSLSAALKQAQGSAFKASARVLTDRDYCNMQTDNDGDDDHKGGSGDSGTIADLPSSKGTTAQGKSAHSPHSAGSVSASARARHDRKLAHADSRAFSEPPSLFNEAPNRPLFQNQQPRASSTFARRSASAGPNSEAVDMSKSKAKRSGMRRDYADMASSTYRDGIYAAGYNKGAQKYDSRNYLDMPRHSVIDPSMLSFDLPGTTSSQGGSYSGTAHTQSEDMGGRTMGSPASSFGKTSATGPNFVADAASSGVSAGWSVAKPIGNRFLPLSLSAPDLEDSLDVRSQGTSNISTFSSTSRQVDSDMPSRNYARLRSASDINVTVDAAAYRDNNAARAFMATGMLSDIDDVLMEPADSRERGTSSQSSSSAADKAPANDIPASTALAKPTVKLSRNVRDRLMKARMKQKQKIEEAATGAAPTEDTTDA
ncbi:hypothetical protein LPJ66_009450 [Kickxella alabastrina]|uniref:Uncharacterized protein n=1 Tax=Kickxella alabastrina TaxID=61397 RepID=A0ACC1I4S4_9FUNG|nr:hypothetical protein LPJ66_009450 [Kickxella alabastrina]